MSKSTLRRIKAAQRPFARMVRDADRLCRQLREFGWTGGHREVLDSLPGRPPTDVTDAELLARDGQVSDVVDAIFSTAFALQQFRAALSADYGGRKWFEATEGVDEG